MKSFSAIAFVPARKGSKRLPGKNKKILNKKPLFQYTVEAAVNSRCYDKVILTTDDEEIIKIGQKLEGATILKRPMELATGSVKAKDVVLFHLKHIKRKYDYVSLLMPTTPLRDEQDIRNSFELLIKEKGDSLASVVKYNFHPVLALRRIDKRLYSYFDKEADLNWKRECEYEPAYHVNGGIFTARTEFLLKTGSFINKGTLLYLMSSLKSLDIDTESDFRYGEFIMKERLII